MHLSALARLREAGWLFEPAVAAPTTDASVLGTFPSEVSEWVHSFASLANADDTTWFLAAGDYSETPDDAFAWNEFEKLSLGSAEDEAQSAAVTAFWRRHLPILLSVRDGYAYLAVRDDGRIVIGREPEFEDTRVVAGGLVEMLDELARPRETPSSGAILVEELLGL